MPKKLRYSNPERKWFFLCEYVVDGKTVESGKVWASKIGEPLVYPKDMPQSEREAYKNAHYKNLKAKVHTPLKQKL